MTRGAGQLVSRAATRSERCDNIGQPGPLVYDTFTDTDGVYLSAHAPDVDAVGTGWETFNYWNLGTAENNISNNALATLATPGKQKSNLIDAGVADVVISFDLTPREAGREYRFIIRPADSNNFFICDFRPGLRCQIVEFVDGSATVRATKAINEPVDVTIPVVITVSGSTITADYNDGEHVISYASATANQTGTKFGINTNHGDTDSWLDNFKIEAAA